MLFSLRKTLFKGETDHRRLCPDFYTPCRKELCEAWKYIEEAKQVGCVKYGFAHRFAINQDQRLNQHIAALESLRNVIHSGFGQLNVQVQQKRLEEKKVKRITKTRRPKNAG